jgi:hypothetical protein
MPTQIEAGKAFEYALLTDLFDKLKIIQNVTIIDNKSYEIAQKCYNIFSENDKLKYQLASSAAVQQLFKLEPRLQNPLSQNDKLELTIVPDSLGIKGDVRDVLAIRSAHNWEIGISAKNQHKAVKHSRLSDNIDFGNKWLNINCSEEYFAIAKSLFGELRKLHESHFLWKNIENKDKKFYVPILKAFIEELKKIDQNNPSIVPQRLLHYLIGTKDFYKVIKGNNRTIIQGFNLNGTLNKPSNEIKPQDKVPKIKFPSRIIEFAFKPNSTNTLILTCDEGWQISFRIHNASSRVEPSLKFDINLIGHPQCLYSHYMSWNSI